MRRDVSTLCYIAGGGSLDYATFAGLSEYQTSERSHKPK